ncbi:MAG: tetratricopeptide repeat protein [Saprospiraceae bacterium]|nr:tetratricopeptide repeat protein [Saprospiraceae bacterium]
MELKVCFPKAKAILTPLILVGWFLTMTSHSIGQQKIIDSLLQEESRLLDRRDSSAARLYIELARAHQQVKATGGLQYAEKAIMLSEEMGREDLLTSATAVKGTLHLILRQYNDAYRQFSKAFTISQRRDDTRGMANALNNMGLVSYSLTDYSRALENFLQSLKFNEKIHNAYGLALNYGNIGNIYNALQEYNQAIQNYEKAQAYAKTAGNDQYRDALLNNLGNSYTQLGKFEKALQYKLESLALARITSNSQRIATSLGNVGNVYIKLQEYRKALSYHTEGLALNEGLSDKKLNAAGWYGLGDAYAGLQKADSAFFFFRKAYRQALELNDAQLQANCMEKLSTLYRQQLQMDSAYVAYKRFVDLQTTLENGKKLREITQLTLKHQFSRKEDSLVTVQLRIDNQLKEKSLLAAKQQQELERRQAQLLLAEKQRQIKHLAWLQSQANLRTEQANRKVNEKQIGLLAKEKEVQQTRIQLQSADLAIKEAAIHRQQILAYFYITGIALLLLLAFFIFRNYRNQKRSNLVIERERQKSDGLLLNILPAEVATELKEYGSAQARYYNEVSVIFTDFVGFTRVAESMSPQELVAELNQCFSAFDNIVSRYGIEKIKTIGDAYMAVSGLPTERHDHAALAVAAAREFLNYIRDSQKSSASPFDIRIGIHTGPVVAGIVGQQKFAYDIWGDTVNIASRMESSGLPGAINISGETYQRIFSEVQCSYRGKIDAKNKGQLDMYLVDV